MSLKKSTARLGKLLRNRDYRRSLYAAILLWTGGYLFYRLTIDYVDTLKDARTVGDLVLSNIPVIDLHFLYIYCVPAVMVFLFYYLVAHRPDLIPFGIKLIAGVFIVRTFFIGLTHLGPPQGFLITAIRSDFDYWPFNHMMHENDLFFSGHVAYPFVAALLMGANRRIFWFYLCVSVLMGITVLLMRIHYSIDVFAAYFIVYGVYAAMKRIFGQKDLTFEKLITR